MHKNSWDLLLEQISGSTHGITRFLQAGDPDRAHESLRGVHDVLGAFDFRIDGVLRFRLEGERTCHAQWESYTPGNTV